MIFSSRHFVIFNVRYNIFQDTSYVNWFHQNHLEDLLENIDNRTPVDQSDPRDSAASLSSILSDSSLAVATVTSANPSLSATITILSGSVHFFYCTYLVLSNRF